jgi:hypothetical protein
MGSDAVLNAPGSGWARLAAELAARIPPSEIDALWTFRALRHDGKEWGTALISRVTEAGQRRRIFTARFVHTLKGKERGRFEAQIEEVGSGPLEAVAEIIAGVQRRMDDEVPTPVAPETWFPPAPAAAADDAPSQG